MPLFQTQLHETKTLNSAAQSTLQVPVGNKIQSLALAFYTSAGALVTEAQIRAEITTIRLSMNGKDIVNAQATTLLNLYEAMSVHVGLPAAVPGTVELNLGRLLFADPVARSYVGFGTADVSSIQVQVTAGTLSAIASVQVVTQRSAVNEPLDNYCKIISYVQSFNAIATHTCDTLPRDIDTAYLAVLVEPGASGVMTTGELKINGITITEQILIGLNNLFCSNKGFIQPAGLFVHPMTDGTVAANLPMKGVTDLRLLTGFSTAPGAAGYPVTPIVLVSRALAA